MNNLMTYDKFIQYHRGCDDPIKACKKFFISCVGIGNIDNKDIYNYLKSDKFINKAHKFYKKSFNNDDFIKLASHMIDKFNGNAAHLRQTSGSDLKYLSDFLFNPHYMVNNNE